MLVRPEVVLLEIQSFRELNLARMRSDAFYGESKDSAEGRHRQEDARAPRSMAKGDACTIEREGRGEYPGYPGMGYIMGHEEPHYLPPATANTMNYFGWRNLWNYGRDQDPDPCDHTENAKAARTCAHSPEHLKSARGFSLGVARFVVGRWRGHAESVVIRRVRRELFPSEQVPRVQLLVRLPLALRLGRLPLGRLQVRLQVRLLLVRLHRVP